VSDKETEKKIYLESVRSGIDDVQQELSHLTDEIDFYLSALTPEEFEIDGKALRDMQAKMSRLDADLNTFRRRMV
jgi:uncharacterized damage-inducible protein DinB